MAKAKHPVSVDGIEFDALISEERTLQANIPEYVVEDGFVVNDAVIFNPERITMTLYVTNTPVTWMASHGGPGWIDSVCLRLESLYYKGTPITVITSDRTYQNMCIESITFTKTFEEGYALSIPVTFKQIRKTKAKTTHIPAKYGKSGISYGQAGSSNTNSGSVNLGNLDFSSGNTSSGSVPTNPDDIDLEDFFASMNGGPGTIGGSGSSGSVTGNGSGSILHGIAGALGWI